METLFNNKVKEISLIIAFLVVIFSFTSCSNKVPFKTSSVVPAAKGTVKIKSGKNNNYVIKIELSDLAKPERLQPPRNVYVVWMATTSNATKNIGQIETSTSFLSKQLTSSFETISPIKPTKIFITAEENANIQYPMGQVVLTTEDF